MYTTTWNIKMTKQPSPLLALADRIEEANECPMVISIHAATELRRLQEVNVELLAEFKEIVSDYEFCDKEAGYGPRAFSYYETAKRMVAKVTGETE